MKTQQLKFFGLATALSLICLLLSIPKVSAATVTWDGGGSGNAMSTGGNWVGDVAPVAGDDLIFPAVAAKNIITNDFPVDTSFNSMSFAGDDGYTLGGNSIVLIAGITNTAGSTTLNLDKITLGASQSFSNNATTGNEGAPFALVFNSDLDLGANTLTVDVSSAMDNYTVTLGLISGTGGITKNNAGEMIIGGATPANSYTGSTVINAGRLTAQRIEGISPNQVNTSLGTASSGTTVADGASLSFSGHQSIAEPLTLSGPGNGLIPTLYFEPSKGGPGPCQNYYTATLSSTITILTNDVVIDSSECQTFSFTGAVNGAGNLAVRGVSLINSVSNSDFTVTSTGSLGGSGSVGDVTTQSGGVLAAGNSPGCFSTGNLVLVSGSTFLQEIAGTTVCTQYDQTRVTGTVSLGNATLTVSLLSGFVPAAGQSYTIIENDGSDAVTGTFTGLAQNATFTASGVVYRINYSGGTGNDVVLSVVSVPATPDTGFALVTSNPLISLLTASLASVSILYLGRRYATAKVNR